MVDESGCWGIWRNEVVDNPQVTAGLACNLLTCCARWHSRSCSCFPKLKDSVVAERGPALIIKPETYLTVIVAGQAELFNVGKIDNPAL